MLRALTQWLVGHHTTNIKEKAPCLGLCSQDLALEAVEVCYSSSADRSGLLF